LSVLLLHFWHRAFFAILLMSFLPFIAAAPMASLMGVSSHKSVPLSTPIFIYFQIILFGSQVSDS
jgi:hypothetical protein